QQALQIVQVENWGLPLPHDQWERIFVRFERGMQPDRYKIRRGLGLGLYISRRILRAHGGGIFVKESVPTLDDPARRDNEGWRTVFEIRIPSTLPKGKSRQ